MALAYYSLLGAFFLAVFQFIVPLLGLYHQPAKCWLKWTLPIAFGQFALVTLAFLSLVLAFLLNDFSLSYVIQNSNSHLPWFYRLGAVWGGHEGSVLLWVFILNLWTVAVILVKQNLESAVLSRVLAILGIISAGFLAFLLTLSNPFSLTNHVTTDGRDLNPLLQDPGLIFHPPLLYMGYVGFSVSYAFAIAALLTDRFDKQWAMWMRPWTLAAWCFLTWGIVSGSWWAYRVLGWGGWWFWDPVENASLLPWLAGTALIHSLLVLAKRELFKAWVILLAILTFALSLIGTFIVRSGLLVSVHAFAVDPWRGVFMLTLLVTLIGSSLGIYAWKVHRFSRVSYRFSLLSRISFLLMNNVLLSVAVFTVLLGTLYPLIIEVLGLGKLSVGAPYFNSVFIPLASLLLFLMGFSYWFSWDYRGSAFLLGKIISLLAIALVLSLLLILFFTRGLQWRVIGGLTLALWIILNTLRILWQSLKKNLSFKKIITTQGAMLCAHLGVAITAIGIILSSNYSLQGDVRMAVGDQFILGVYPFKLQDVVALQGPNYTGAIAKLQLSNTSYHLYPELRYYPVSDMALSKPAIHVKLWRDLYVALAEPVGKHAWALRFYYKPFIRWIWCGGLLMMLGGIWAIVRPKK